MDQPRPRTALVGAKLILFGLLIGVACGRWGSYLGISLAGVSIADMLVLAGVAIYLSSTQYVNLRGRLVGLYSLCLALVIVVALYITGTFSSLVLRDAATFVYLLLLPIFISAIRSLDGQLVRKWLFRALIFHTLWYLPITLGLLKPISLGLISSVPAFLPRNDFDALVSGLAIVAAFVLGIGRVSARWLLVLGASVCILANGSRAGFLGALLAIAVYAVLQRPWQSRKNGPYIISAVCIGAAISLVMLAADTLNMEWSKVLRKLIPSENSDYASALNTSEARSLAWSRIMRYVEYQDGEILGLGFGTDYIQRSGAIEFLSGDPSVRQPHNFVVSWYAMLGAAGTLIVLLALGALLWQAARAYRASELEIFGWCVISGVLVASLVGVIMESPFGYSTFVLGIICASFSSSKHTEPTWGDSILWRRPADPRKNADS